MTGFWKIWGLNGLVLPIRTITTTRTKPSKMQKVREDIIYWIFKFAGSTKMGLWILFLISIVGFFPVFYVWKSEDAQEVQVPPSLHAKGIKNLTYVGKAYRPLPPYFRGYTLPQEHPCNSFTLPPPPGDKKKNRTTPFVKGPESGRGTGFDINETDLLAMKRCRGIVVVSAVFDDSDDVKSPRNISKYSVQTVCFFMFVDEKTEAKLKRDKSFNGTTNKVGLWRVVVVHNLPYSDGRRNGKIPKLLVHSLFPNSRYSLWIDGKLDLVIGPHQILERFLWSKNVTIAISRHYSRFDVFVEAEANKVAGKYDNASIDFQVNFYKKEGLTPYSAAKLPITTDVPEGCVILREHLPISNLFVCLWFNEVDRFTPRDQISFSTVRDKIAAKTKWNGSMFLDCENATSWFRDTIEQIKRN